MSFRTTYILFGILIVELVAFGLNQVFSTRPGEELFVLPELHRADARERGNSADATKGIAKDIDRVEINHAGGEKIVLTRDKDAKRWVMTEPYATAVEDDTAVNAVIANLVSARKEDKVDVRGKKLSDTGLEPPKVQVTLTKNDGQKWTLNIGDKHELNGRGLLFVNSSDLPKEIMAVKQNNLEGLFRNYQVKVKVRDPQGKEKEQSRSESRWKTAKDFRTKDLVTSSSMTLKSVDLKDGKHELALEREGDLTKWKFTKPDYGPAEYDPTNPNALPGPGGAPPVTSVKQLLSTLEGIKVAYDPDNPDKKEDDFVAENVKDLAKYGLEKGKPSYLRIGFERGVGGTLLGPDPKAGTIKDALLIGNEAGTAGAAKPNPDFGVTLVGLAASLQGQAPLLAAAAVPAKPADGGKDLFRYARLESENNVVKIPARAVEQLVKVTDDPSDLRNRQLVQIDEPKVDAIDVRKAGGATLKLRKVGDAWKLWDDTDKGALADKGAVNILLTGLAPPRGPDQRPPVLSFPRDDAKDADLGLDDKQRSGEITLYEEAVDQEAAKKDEKAEPKLKEKPGKVIKLVFGKKMDNNVVNVIRDAGDRKTRLTVSDAMLTRLDDNRLAYLDRTLPTFDEKAPLARITVQYKGDKKDKDVELVKEKKDDKTVWSIKKPDNVTSHNADPAFVSSLIDRLRNLNTDKLVAEKPADAKESEGYAKKLAEYGLNPAEVTVTVTHEKNDKGVTPEYVYTFGKEADKDGKRYARIEVKPPDEKKPARDLVFVVQPEILKALQANLVDPTVFAFKAEDVKKLKLTGWKKKSDKVETLEVEREGTEGKWKVLNKIEGYELDSPAVTSFVFRLSHLKAEKFLDHKVTNPKPDFELDPAHRNLEIEVVLKEKVKDDKEKDKEKEVEKTLTLTIGKFHEGPGTSPEEKKASGYYDAQSSTLPGDVFALPRSALPLTEKEKLDVVEAGLKYFGKLP